VPRTIAFLAHGIDPTRRTALPRFRHEMWLQWPDVSAMVLYVVAGGLGVHRRPCARNVRSGGAWHVAHDEARAPPPGRQRRTAPGNFFFAPRARGSPHRPPRWSTASVVAPPSASRPKWSADDFPSAPASPLLMRNVLPVSSTSSGVIRALRRPRSPVARHRLRSRAA